MIGTGGSGCRSGLGCRYGEGGRDGGCQGAVGRRRRRVGIGRTSMIMCGHIDELPFSDVVVPESVGCARVKLLHRMPDDNRDIRKPRTLFELEEMVASTDFFPW
jgi:hypothetical protein